MLKLDVVRSVYALILASVTLSAFAQIALKGGMASAPVQKAIADGPPTIWTLIHISFNPLVLFGLFLYFSSAVVWLFVLSRVEVSFAYPFVALGFVLTAIMGRIFFHDSFSFEKMAGTALIILGVVLISRSH